MKRSVRTYLQAAVLALAPLALPATAGAQVSAEQTLVIGRNVLAMDDYVLSIQYFNQAIKAKPYLSDPYYYRGLAKLMLEDWKGAEADCSEAIGRNKYKVEPYRVRGFARMHLGLDSLAVADFDRGLEYAPQDRYFLFYKGVALADMEQFARADTTLTHLLEMAPRFTEGRTARAQVRLALSDTAGAVEDARRSIELDKNAPGPYLLLAEISTKQRDWPTAADALDRALSLSPRETNLYVNRAFVRYNLDDWSGAMADYNYALDLDPECRPALYNRALLRSQVQDLAGAVQDFGRILEWDPEDFPTRFNRALSNMDLRRYNLALQDLQRIAKRYPRFYPVYQAMGQCYYEMGNQKAAADMLFKANDMIARYTDNPKKYRLDRPTIESGASRMLTQKGEDAADQTPEQVMEQFNQLVTISASDDVMPVYGEKLKGKVQDTNMRVEPMGFFALTFTRPFNDIKLAADFAREVDEINRNEWLPSTLYLSSTASQTPDDEQSASLFAYTQGQMWPQDGKLRPVDYLGQAVAYTMLKNYEAAVKACDSAIAAAPRFGAPLLQRAFVRTLRAAAHPDMASAELRAAAQDLDDLIAMQPQMPHAWYDRGLVSYLAGDYTSALEAMNRALAMNPELGEALYNRGLAYLRLGDKARARADLSRAGELGIPAAYNLLKRLK